MDNWYIPITIVPGIGLLLMSTSQLLVALSNEIKEMLSDKDVTKQLMNRKLTQLKLLNAAMVFLYVSVACFIVSGLIMAMNQTYDFHLNSAIYSALLGISSALGGLVLLIIYSYRAVRIRQSQYHGKC